MLEHARECSIYFSKGFFLIFFSYSYHSNSQSLTLFDPINVIGLTLSGDLNSVFKDRKDSPDYHPVTLSYQDRDEWINIPIKIKTRGHFRKSSSNCKYPPLLFNFPKKSLSENSIFSGQDKLKLVTPCQGDQYILHEYLVYQLYNLFTERSFKTQLVRVTYLDSLKKKKPMIYYGMLIEDEDQMAMRNASVMTKKIGWRPAEIQREDFLQMAVFEYMIGNTDWSVQYQQNTKLIMKDNSAAPIAVPYDFDHAGIVRAPYAKPALELQLSSTVNRRYRGFCIKDMEELKGTFDQFNRLKESIYGLYINNSLLNEGYRNQTIKFLDQFYETINDPEKAKNAFTYPCDSSGTGNVVIKGLKKQ